MKPVLPSVAVIIPTKNRPSDLEVTIRTLLAQTVLPQHLIIIDQSSDDDSRCRVQRLFEQQTPAGPQYPKLSYESNHAITGGAMARNHAMQLAQGDVWLFLDDDVSLESNFIEELLYAYCEYPQAAGISGIVTNYSRPPWFKRSWDLVFLCGPFRDLRQSVYWRANQLRDSKPIPVDRLGAGLMSFRSSVIRNHRFDQDLCGVSDGEDVDFCLRLGPHALLMIAPRARLEHRQSTGGRLHDHYLRRQARSEYFLYWKNWNHGIKNRLCFAWMNVGFALQAMLGILRRCSFEPWRALRAGVRDARTVACASIP
jgi:GT2 family glycosyltransferase